MVEAANRFQHYLRGWGRFHTTLHSHLHNFLSGGHFGHLVDHLACGLGLVAHTSNFQPLERLKGNFGELEP